MRIHVYLSLAVCGCLYFTHKKYRATKSHFFVRTGASIWYINLVFLYSSIGPLITKAFLICL